MGDQLVPWYSIRMTDYVPPAKLVYVQQLVKRHNGRFMMRGPINVGWRTVLVDVAFEHSHDAQAYAVRLTIVQQAYFS